MFQVYLYSDFIGAENPTLEDFQLVEMEPYPLSAAFTIDITKNNLMIRGFVIVDTSGTVWFKQDIGTHQVFVHCGDTVNINIEPPLMNMFRIIKKKFGNHWLDKK